METKICSKCNLEQELCFFQKDKSKKDGYRPDCKNCRKLYNKLNSHKFKERNSNYKKNERKKNPEKFAERERIYRVKNPYKVKLRRKTYYENNKESQFKYVRDRRKVDHVFKLSNNVRRRINIFLSLNNINKKNKTFNIVGCSPDFLKKHLESQFIENMSWDNYGFYGWHIDHIIPLSSAKNEKEIFELCHYSNLQPLWAGDNLKKGGEIIKKGLNESFFYYCFNPSELRMYQFPDTNLNSTQENLSKTISSYSSSILPMSGLIVVKVIDLITT